MIMGFIIFVVIVLIIAGLANALANRTPDHPRRRARALNVARPIPVASTGTHTDTSDSLASLAITSHGMDYQPLDDHTRNTDSSTSWNSGANDCAPSDSGSWGSGGDSGGSTDSGGCDSGSFD